MTKMIQVTDDIHADLMTLKGVLSMPNPSKVIRSLMLSRGYTEEFFERVREDVVK